MARFVLTGDAETDIADTWAFIAENFGESNADAWAAHIEHQCGTLAEFPDMGRVRPELGPKVRSFPVLSHVIFYVRDKKRIVVLRILHGARDVDAAFAAAVSDRETN